MIPCTNYAYDWCYMPEILPIMPVLCICSMLFDAHYVPNHTSILYNRFKPASHAKFFTALDTL